MRTFYSDSLRRVLETLNTDPDRGLSGQEAARRLAAYGPNQLDEAPQAGKLRQVLGQLKDPMILVLLAAAALSFFAGGGRDWLDAAIILGIVVFNTVISVSQEDNARKALEALRKLSSPKAKVLRDGGEAKLDSTDLVPGDIVWLEAGDYVPADGRILWEAGLQTDESAMTGESGAVAKRDGSGLPPDTPLAERKNMVIGGTVVTGGRGKIVVTGTGMDSEMGKIAGLLLRQQQGQTPLQRKMGEVSQVLSLVCVGVCAVMFGVGMLQHRDILDMFLTAVALAVAAIPEGLPAIVTIVLAIGVGRMAKRNAIIKRLPAVETLGCASVICSDKTGTLTKNQMAVLDVWTAAPGKRPLALTLGTLCSDAKPTPDGTDFTGDPRGHCQNPPGPGLPPPGGSALRCRPQAHGHLPHLPRRRGAHRRERGPGGRSGPMHPSLGPWGAETPGRREPGADSFRKPHLGGPGSAGPGRGPAGGDCRPQAV